MATVGHWLAEIAYWFFITMVGCTVLTGMLIGWWLVRDSWTARRTRRLQDVGWQERLAALGVLPVAVETGYLPDAAVFADQVEEWLKDQGEMQP